MGVGVIESSKSVFMLGFAKVMFGLQNKTFRHLRVSECVMTESMVVELVGCQQSAASNTRLGI